MAERTRSKTTELQFQEFRDETKSFMASTAKSLAELQKSQEEQIRQFDDFKKFNEKRMEQLADFVRNPPDLGQRREQQSDAANSDRRNSVGGGSELMAADRTLLIKVRLELYPISWEILDEIFSKFGMIEYLEVFCRGEEYHSMVRFRKKESAMEAMDSLNHREIYDNWCRLELFLLSLIEPPSLSNREVTGGIPMTVGAPRVGVLNPGIEAITEDSTTQEISRSPSETESAPIESDDIQNSQESPRNAELKVEVLLGKVLGNSGEELSNVGNPVEESEVQVTPHVVEEDSKEPERIQEEVIVPSPKSFEPVKVNSFPNIASDYMSATLGELVGLLIEFIEMRLSDFSTNSVKCFRNLSAHKVFVEMPTNHVQVQTRLGDGTLILSTKWCLNSLSRGTSAYLRVFDPGGAWDGLSSKDTEMPYDRGRNESISCCLDSSKGGFDSLDGEASEVAFQWSCISVVGITNSDRRFIRNGLSALPFDRGKTNSDVVKAQMEFWKAAFDLKDMVLVFDPEGMVKPRVAIFLMSWLDSNAYHLSIATVLMDKCRMLDGYQIFESGIAGICIEASKMLNANVLPELKKGKEMVVKESDCSCFLSATNGCEAVLGDGYRAADSVWIFDPGGMLGSGDQVESFAPKHGIMVKVVHMCCCIWCTWNS